MFRTSSSYCFCADLDQGRYEEAEQLLAKTFETNRQLLGTHPHTLQSWKNLIDLYEAWGKSEKADEWRTKLSPKEAAVQ